jgi:hypothetical protein
VRNHLLLPVLIVVLAGICCGCSRSEAGVSSSPPAQSTTAQISYPLDKYALTDQQTSEIIRATYKLQRECLKEFGLGYNFKPTAGYVGSDRVLPSLTLREAEGSGYRSVDSSQSYIMSRNFTDVPSFSLSADLENVFYGRIRTYDGHLVPPGGCEASAEEKVERGIGTSELQPDPRSVIFAAETHVETEGRVREVFTEWGECMRSAGYDYSDPITSTYAFFSTNIRMENTPAAEIRTATADVKCRQQVNLMSVWVAAETAYEQNIIERQHASLARSRSAYTLLLANAQRILASSPP